MLPARVLAPEILFVPVKLDPVLSRAKDWLPDSPQESE
jgi:hypothetical protein